MPNAKAPTKLKMTRSAFGPGGALLEEGKTYELPYEDCIFLINRGKAVFATEEPAKPAKKAPPATPGE